MKKIGRLLISIPAYNESQTINKVLTRIPAKLPNVKNVKILVIDDGSNDHTSNKIRKRGVYIIRHMINRGLGASIGTAFKFAKQKKFDLLVTMDADGQHDPLEVDRLIKPIIIRGIDVVIGSRLIKNSEKMPLSRKIVNNLANVITYLFTGIWSSDTQSGFRAFSKKAINKIELVSQRMEVSSEIFSEINKYKLSYTEIPVKTMYSKYSLGKGQSLVNAPNVFLKLLISLARR